MQGFNKYYPPDFDPRETHTLNDYRGVHALGKRAKDIDKGVLVVRFELPFNIWCLSCPNSSASSTHATSSTSGRLSGHLGAGVRYNAQKIRVGAYYSTPIWGFRCKCHLCGGWFEIRTDPKNAQYVVHSGAKKQEADWDPEENGGFAVHDTEAPTASEPPTDAFLALDKSTTQSTQAQTKSQRYNQLISLSDRAHSDPYTLSRSLRKVFRNEKKVESVKAGADNEIRDRIGLRDGIKLIRMDTEEEIEAGRAEFRRARERVAVGRVTKGKGKAIEQDVTARAGLVRVIKANTAKRIVGDAFGSVLASAEVRKATRGSSGLGLANKEGIGIGNAGIVAKAKFGKVMEQDRTSQKSLIGMMDYGSEED